MPRWESGIDGGKIGGYSRKKRDCPPGKTLTANDLDSVVFT